ncbi:MAG: hypothetical protein HYT93_05180 [Parcubacteria group bacterium]|nr:hypothetical protein [Parcubacteria group bacterium]
MKNFFTPAFLKFFTRFIMILLIGVVGVLIFGNLNTKQKQARTFQPEIPNIPNINSSQQ